MKRLRAYSLRKGRSLLLYLSLSVYVCVLYYLHHQNATKISGFVTRFSQSDKEFIGKGQRLNFSNSHLSRSISHKLVVDACVFCSNKSNSTNATNIDSALKEKQTPDETKQKLLITKLVSNRSFYKRQNRTLPSRDDKRLTANTNGTKIALIKKNGKVNRKPNTRNFADTSTNKRNMNKTQLDAERLMLKKYAEKLMLKFNEIFRFSPMNDTMDRYFERTGNTTCFSEGTARLTLSGCVCRDNWFGEYCSIPVSVYTADNSNKYFRLRQKPRRIYQTLIFNNEWGMLDYRIRDTGSVVDGFIIVEGVYTGYGDTKRLNLISKLVNGLFPNNLTEKIIPVVMDYFPDGAYSNGWLFENTARDEAFAKGIPKQLIGSVDDDDIFLHTDADEVPSRDVLLFLRLHDNLPEPFHFNLRKTVYGFFWYSSPWHMYAGCTFRVLKEVYQLKNSNLRQYLPYNQKLLQMFQKFHSKHNVSRNQTGPLLLGTDKHPAGFHCSWCSTPEGICNKMLSAINADFPRMGDFPKMCDPDTLKAIIGSGATLSGTACLTAATPQTSRQYFAPEIITKNPTNYAYLLNNPYVNSSVRCSPRNNVHAFETPFLKNWHRMTKYQFTDAMNKTGVKANIQNLVTISNNHQNLDYGNI